MNRSIWIASTLALASLMATFARAGEIGFLEDFALAKDRAAVLKQLIPGSEDYYYYHALHYQNTEQYDKVDALLPTWIQRHGHTARVREILHRQALLTYDKTPEKTLAYLQQGDGPAVQPRAATSRREGRSPHEAQSGSDHPRNAAGPRVFARTATWKAWKMRPSIG